MEFLVIWVLFGICAAIVASNRGANGCLWFGLGVALGPIGFALAFTTGVKCPKCDSRVSLNARVCPRCGQPLAIHQPQQGVIHTESELKAIATRELKAQLDAAPPELKAQFGSAPPRVPEATKRCPFCAEEILAEAKKCRYCGEFLEKPSN